MVMQTFAQVRMKTRKLPRFEPVGVDEGRVFWKKYRGNADVERMLLELAQARQTMEEIGAYFDSVRKAWEEENLGQLVAMEKIRLLLMEQDLRYRTLAGLKPPPRDADPGEPEPALVD
ncbi:hypothetical protein AWB74_08485 [Caballeronia arvi]|uniref:Uncharacterized protein n=1 Tax=Caballeronia arvi TaxID=1777135 RepID=A0A158L4K0_9BURK|nr:hypothetical protein [Caballeronia arvi]SAL88278.1 hypothetical protein AWB74_08485 [Caballeronia arvi]